ncbi:MAG TPA: MSMEG_0565 family glycosyltransferase [Streptosporangiaceae bacterium]|nr:MSMEG_0565 family glycosyltransferase [Streptosporangiaceae bacterium]
MTRQHEITAPPRVALITYTTRPRGGPVHCLELADALHRSGCRVHVYALGDPAEGFFRPVRTPHAIFPAPGPEGTLEDRVQRAFDALCQGLGREHLERGDFLHAEDCVAGRAAVAIRDAGAPVVTVRTVHHVDDFTTKALIDCQRRSIIEPDHVIVVSRFWQALLREEFGVDADVVTSGVGTDRFREFPPDRARTLRARAGATGRTLFLTVGGIEPRKGSRDLVEALAMLRHRMTPSPVLAVVGGHSFQDHRPYAESVLTRARDLGLETGRNIVQLGTVPDAELPVWYHAADVFVYPSVKEGWGLALLEAMAAGLPAVATDIPVPGIPSHRSGSPRPLLGPCRPEPGHAGRRHRQGAAPPARPGRPESRGALHLGRLRPAAHCTVRTVLRTPPAGRRPVGNLQGRWHNMRPQRILPTRRIPP